MIRRLFMARLAFNTLFFIPFIVLYAHDIGLSFSQLMLIESGFGILLLSLDLPCGHFADNLGPKYALILGGFAQGMACLALYLFPNRGAFIATQVLFAVAIALTRGADSALNYSLQTAPDHTFEQSESRFLTYALAAEAMAFFIGGLISTRGYAGTYLATAILQILGSLWLLPLPSGLTLKSPPRMSFTDRLKSIHQSVSTSTSAKCRLLGIILVGSAFTTLLYLAPALMREAGMKSIQLGSLFAMATLASSLLAQKRSTILSATTVALAGFGFMLSNHWGLLLVGVAFLKMSRASLLPKFRARAVERFGHWGQATALSLVSTCFTGGFALVGPMMGLLSDRFGLKALVGTNACVFLAGASLSVYYDRK